MDATEDGATGAARLAAARAALARAEQRAGLRESSAREIRRAVARTLGRPLAASPPVPGTQGTAALAPQPPPGPTCLVTDPLSRYGLSAEASGVLSLTGSVSALLTAAARRQGRYGWCGVVGHEGLSWVAAAEAGLALERVLAVRGALLDPGTVPTVVRALLDGVDVLLLAPWVVSGLRPRERRALRARARERGSLIVTPAPWEGARSLTAVLLDVDQRPGRAAGDGPQGLRRAPTVRTQGTGSPTPLRPAATEMPGGYIHRLVWSLRDESRPLGESWLVLDTEGARIQAPGDQGAAAARSVTADGAGAAARGARPSRSPVDGGSR